jgi:hypothetical protein
MCTVLLPLGGNPIAVNKYIMFLIVCYILSVIQMLNDDHTLNSFRFWLCIPKFGGCANSNDTTDTVLNSFGGLRGSLLPLSTQVHGFKPSQSNQDFSGQKNPRDAFLQRGSKAVGPMSQICSM